jgi:hypothetical protein
MLLIHLQQFQPLETVSQGGELKDVLRILK